MKVQAILFLLTAPVLMVSFQNCESSGSGSAGASNLNSSQSSGSASVSPAPTATATPISVAVSTACIDDLGVSHDDGSTWQETETPKNPSLCAGTVENYLLRAETVTYLCVDTQVVQVGDSFGPLNYIAACETPSISVLLDPTRPISGDGANVDISTANLSGVALKCTETTSGDIMLSQAVASGSVTVPVNFVNDTTCVVSGSAADGSTLSAQVDVNIDCGSQIKDGGVCKDFSCQQFVAIAPDANGVIQVPARTSAGICYSMKMASAIANSASNLTTTIDTQVVSRNHDANPSSPSIVHNPYLMASSLLNFNLAGARSVKVAGSGDSLQPILVDNFVLRGIYPQGTVNPDVSFYKAYGSGDSTVGTTGGVLLDNNVVLLQAFASGGTSTLAPLDLTNSVKAGSPYTLDFRAEDCGGSRQLSDLYLVFQ